MSTADVLAKLPHLKGFKRKSKAKFNNLEFRIFEDPNDEDGVYFTVENTKTKEILDISNDYFYDFEKKFYKLVEQEVKTSQAKTAMQYVEAYLNVVNNIPEEFAIALASEVYGRSSWGSLGNIVKDIKKLLSAKTLEFQEDMSPQDGFNSNNDYIIALMPKDMEEEFGDASFRIELQQLDHHSQVCNIVTD